MKIKFLVLDKIGKVEVISKAYEVKNLGDLLNIYEIYCNKNSIKYNDLIIKVEEE